MVCMQFIVVVLLFVVVGIFDIFSFLFFHGRDGVAPLFIAVHLVL